MMDSVFIDREPAVGGNGGVSFDGLDMIFLLTKRILQGKYLFDFFIGKSVNKAFVFFDFVLYNLLSCEILFIIIQKIKFGNRQVSADFNALWDPIQYICVYWLFCRGNTQFMEFFDN